MSIQDMLVIDISEDIVIDVSRDVFKKENFSLFKANVKSNWRKINEGITIPNKRGIRIVNDMYDSMMYALSGVIKNVKS